MNGRVCCAGTPASQSAGSIAAARQQPCPRPLNCSRRPVGNTWVDPRVENVSDKVDDEIGCCSDEHDRLQQREVTPLDRVDGEFADPAPAKHYLDDEGSTRKVHELTTTRGNHRKKRVRQGVPKKDIALRCPVCARRPDVIAPKDIENV